MREWLAATAATVAARVAERRGAVSGDAAETLKSVIDTFAQDYPDAGATASDPHVEAAGRLGVLCAVFGLDRAASDLLVAALAPDLDATFGIAYDLLTGNAAHGRVTVGLALDLAGIPSAAAEAFGHLDPAAPLRRNRLVEVVGDGPWLRRALRVPDRVTSFVAGLDEPVPEVAAAAIDTLPYPAPVASAIADALRSARAPVWVRAPRGSAGASVAVAACREAGLPYLAVDLRRAGVPLADLIALAAREAAFAGAGLILAGAEVFASGDGHSPAVRAALAELESCRIPVVAVGSCGWDPEWLRVPAISFEAPLLTADDRTAIWAQTLGVATARIEEEALSELRLSPNEILTAARYARQVAELNGVQVTAAGARSAVRELSRSSDTGGAPSVREPVGFDDLILPDRVMRELRRLVSWARHRDEVLQRGPVHGKGDHGEGLSALFTGAPGTGKTLAAHVIADELGLELMQVELPTVVDKYIGETEKNLERIFHDAERRNVVLFFDEADALFGSRSEVKDARDRYANQEVAYLLQRMEHFSGITLLATNLRGNLDKAFSRRMHFIVHFPDPDQRTRFRLWSRLLANAGPLDEADPIDIDALAAAGDLAGGDIRNVVLAATYDATAEGSPTGMRHVLAAKEREFQKLGRRPSNA